MKKKQQKNVAGFPCLWEYVESLCVRHAKLNEMLKLTSFKNTANTCSQHSLYTVLSKCILLPGTRLSLWAKIKTGSALTRLFYFMTSSVCQQPVMVCQSFNIYRTWAGISGESSGIREQTCRGENLINIGCRCRCWSYSILCYLWHSIIESRNLEH